VVEGMTNSGYFLVQVDLNCILHYRLFHNDVVEKLKDTFTTGHAIKFPGINLVP